MLIGFNTVPSKVKVLRVHVHTIQVGADGGRQVNDSLVGAKDRLDTIDINTLQNGGIRWEFNQTLNVGKG